jgi:hypothetical protein
MALYEITSEDLPLDFECTMENNFVERTIRNAKNLLMCRRGEIPMDQQRGLDQSILDLPFNQANELITAELDRVMLWEPDVEVDSAWLERDERGETIVHCVIDVVFEED